MSSEKLDLAVAFIGEQALEDLPFSPPYRKPHRIICNLDSGATNPYVLKKLRKVGYRLKNHSKLHAKVYIGDEAAIITSANFSANGLGLENDELNGWLEAGYAVKDLNELSKIRHWFEQLWNSIQHEITREDIEFAELKWKERRRVRPHYEKTQKKSILSELRENPSALRDRNIYIIMFNETLSENAQSKLAEIKNASKYGENLSAYQDWEDLPRDAYFIDLYIGPRNGVSLDGIFNSFNSQFYEGTGIVHFEDNDDEDSSLFLINQVNKIDNIYILTTLDKNLIKEKTLELFDSALCISDEDGGAKYIDIYDAREILLN